MNINVKELVYTATGDIDMLIEHPLYGWIPFTASPNDVEEHSRELFAQAVSGVLGDVVAYTPPTPLVLSAYENIKAQIKVIKATITQQRLLDAILSDEGKTWLTEQNKAIIDLQEQMKTLEDEV